MAQSAMHDMAAMHLGLPAGAALLSDARASHGGAQAPYPPPQPYQAYPGHAQGPSAATHPAINAQAYPQQPYGAAPPQYYYHAQQQQSGGAPGYAYGQPAPHFAHGQPQPGQPYGQQ